MGLDLTAVIALAHDPVVPGRLPGPLGHSPSMLSLILFPRNSVWDGRKESEGISSDNLAAGLDRCEATAFSYSPPVPVWCRRFIAAANGVTARAPGVKYKSERQGKQQWTTPKTRLSTSQLESRGRSMINWRDITGRPRGCQQEGWRTYSPCPALPYRGLSRGRTRPSSFFFFLLFFAFICLFYFLFPPFSSYLFMSRHSFSNVVYRAALPLLPGSGFAGCLVPWPVSSSFLFISCVPTGHFSSAPRDCNFFQCVASRPSHSTTSHTIYQSN